MSRPFRAAAAGLLFAAVTALTIRAGYFRMFSFFADWDDEGYMLVSLRCFRAIGALYSQVYSQYGPVYFVVMDVLFDALGLPLTHDGGRLVTLGVWVAASLVCGVTTWRLTRNVGLGLCSQLLVFRCLFVLHFEPMHPGGLACLLLSCLAVAPLLHPWRPRLAATFLGAGLAAVTLVKTNVGAFALLATAFSCASSIPGLARRRGLVIGTGLAMAVLPFVLMGPALHRPWAQRYALHVAVAAVTVAVAVRASGPHEGFRTAHLGWLAAGGTGLALVVCTAVLVNGTRPFDLVHTMLIRPLGQAEALTVPTRLPRSALLVDLLAVATCIGAVLSQGRFRRAGLVEGPLRLSVGMAMLATASGLSLATGLFAVWTTGFVMAPFAWLAAWAPSGVESSAALTVARRLLPPLAVLQTLVAYSVAGLTQVQLSSFLLIPLGAICVADGARQLARSVAPLATPGWPRRLASAGAALALLAVTLRGVHIQMESERVLYEGNVPLGLPGTARVRIPAAEALPMRALVADLRGRCSTFISLPGVNSFYLWAEQEPPTAANAGTWMFLFEAPLQARIVDRLRGIDRLCGVRHPSLVAMYARGRPVPPRPLAEYFASAFTPVAQHGPYTLLARR